MVVFLGSDHKGFEMKNQVLDHLAHKGIGVEDEGAVTFNKDDDYPKYAFSVCTKLLGEGDGEAYGILLCGSGQGMAMAANKVPGIRAALVWSPQEARAARHDDDANVLVLPANMIDIDTALAVVDAFIDQKFSGLERHKRRLEQIEEIYGG
ncbi:MAG TPA: RpiB/LacA/LacB family sugar-phosphate isomerase [Candidatus Saccharimonadales bacterium]|nr:RpiB/LacA/LacB family sugar-phosphate isomerase [Candidatus Saccharimonadales bacterium]